MSYPKDSHLSGFSVNVVQYPVIPAIYPKGILLPFEADRVMWPGLLLQSEKPF